MAGGMVVRMAALLVGDAIDVKVPSNKRGGRGEEERKGGE
jgi:hypothetical protein